MPIGSSASRARRAPRRRSTIPNILTIHDVGTHDGAAVHRDGVARGRTLRALMDGGRCRRGRRSTMRSQIARRPRRRARQGHRAPRPQAGEHLRHPRRPGEDPRLRPRASSTKRRRGGATQTHVGPTSPAWCWAPPATWRPSRCAAQRADHRSDLFAFGVILYEMLSGQPAFAGSTGVETMTAVLNDEPPDLRCRHGAGPSRPGESGAPLPRETPDRRFHSATDLAFAIGTVQTSRILMLAPRRR